LKTISDHIGAWRVQNGLTQNELAHLLFVSEEIIVIWEKNKSAPRFRQMPAISKPLGCLPIKINTPSLGGKILHYRLLNGLSPYHFGRLVSADPTTVRPWEKGSGFPAKKMCFVSRRLFTHSKFLFVKERVHNNGSEYSILE
jgi:DNA-binding transcriptional regulator YiaG